MSKAWWDEHKCPDGPQPCWEQGPTPGICPNCGQVWPACLTDDALKCVYTSGDMLDSDDLDLLFAEVRRRGLGEP